MTAPLGEVIYASVKPIFKIYFIIAMGWWLARKNILTVSTCRDLSDAVVTAIMPCLIYHNIVSNLQSSDIKFIGIVFFEGTVLFAMGGLLAFLTYFVCKSPKKWFGGLLSVGLFPNISDLPIAYLQTLSKTGSLFSIEQGNEGVAYVCIFLASQVFYQFSLGLFRLIQYDFREQLDDSEKAVRDPQTNLTETTEVADPKTSQEEKNTKPEGDNSLLLLADDNRSFAPEDLAPRLIASPEPLDCEYVRLRDNTLERLNTGSCAQSIESESRSVTSGYQMSAVGRSVSRSLDLRKQKSQDIKDVIHEYSEFDRLRSREIAPPPLQPYDNCVQPRDVEPEEPQEPISKKILKYLKQMLKNFCTPNSLSLIVSLIIALSPPLKALFVPTNFHMPNAPDGQPPLSFVIDITSYVGAASVPIGLLLLGATIARLKVKKVVPGFWKTVVMITAVRLIIMPIFGVGFTTGIAEAGWYDGNNLLRFVSVLEFGLPNATALIYFTAFHTDPLSEDHLQMDCLALCLIAQYCVLFITLPILVTFTLKVSLHK